MGHKWNIQLESVLRYYLNIYIKIRIDTNQFIPSNTICFEYCSCNITDCYECKRKVLYNNFTKFHISRYLEPEVRMMHIRLSQNNIVFLI